MKKGLSILLVAAALFGFYGGAVNINDVLACKDYWEEAGKKSTADMNKLEDGLNQLKDNEQAYLDGKDQLAEGEAALADGEAQYAAGKAQLAKGEADYAAAPAKLADARKQIAAGEDELSDGEDAIDGLTKLINGIKKIRKNYKKWKKGYDALHENRQKLVAGLDAPATKEATVKQVLLGSVAPQLEDAQEAFEAAVKGIDDDNQYAKGYKTFAKNGRTVAAGLEGLIENLKKLSGACDTITGAYGDGGEVGQATLQQYLAGSTDLQTAAVKLIVMATTAQGSAVDPATAQSMVKAAAQGDADMLGTINNCAKGAKGSIDGNVSALSGLKAAYTDNLVKFADAVDENIDTLDDGQQQLADGVATVASNVLGNKTLKAGVKKNFGNKGIKLLKKYKSGKGPLGTSKASFASFENQMDENPGVDAFLLKAQKLLAKTKAEGKDKLAAGKKKLAAGKKQYAQGLADYKAAPAKLADGRAKLADAEQQLADGYQQLEDGKAQLAQYEDGEQQVRDGLATLVGTEPDLDLEGIASRLNGDTDFDNGDDHLDLDEGLNAVEVGRGYQADDGVLITDEIMARAVGTGALLGAGVLAVLAAILSFLKKNKGAGVFAILAAAAGAFGAFYGTNAGTYFSNIAGSTAGSTAWVAAGILGAVALVHAIVHFTAKKEVA